MAVTETVKIIFTSDTKAVTDTIDELVKLKKITEEEAASLKKLTEGFNNAGRAAEDTSGSFVSLSKQVKQAKDEVQRMSEKFGEFSAEANAARTRAAQLTKQMGDLNTQINLINPEAKIQAFSRLAQGVVGSFQIMTGALQVFGAENERVQKLAMKLQGALNVVQGIESIVQLTKAYNDLKVVLGFTATAQKSLAVANEVEAASAQTAAVANRSLAASLGPILLILAAATAAWYLYTDAQDENVAKQLKDFEELKKNQQVQLELLKLTGASELEILETRKQNNKINQDTLKTLGQITTDEKEKETIAGNINDLKREELILNQQIKVAVDNATVAELQRQQAIRDAAAATADSLKAQFFKELQDRLNGIDKETDQRKKAAVLNISNTRDQQSTILAIELDSLNQRKQELKDAGQDLTDIELEIAAKTRQIKKQESDWEKEDAAKRTKIAKELYQETYDFILTLSQSYYQREQQELEKQREQGIITEEQYQQKLKKIKQNQARQDKELAIFAATVSLAEAIVKALTIKPPASFAAAAATAAIAGLNLAKIIATPLPKFKQGTLSVPGTDTGQDTVMAMLRPGEAVIPTETNREYAPALRAIYRRDINAKELNDFVTNREQGAFAFNQVSLDALYKRDLKVSALTQAGKSAQLTAQPAKITADVDVQQLTRAMSKNKAVEVTNTAALGEAIAAQLSKRINPRQVI